MPVVSKFSRRACLAGLIFAFMNEASVPTKKNHVFGRLLRRGDESSESRVQPQSNIFDDEANEDIGKIIKWMNNAHSTMSTLNLPQPPTPKFVVLGMQSAGKTRLIETIAGVPFNYVSDGTASTRPTRITFLKDGKIPKGETRWSIREEDGKMTPIAAGELTKKLKELHTENTAYDDYEEEDVAVISKKYIELECKSKSSYNIVIVDLPGMMEDSQHIPDGTQTKRNIKMINNMTRDHIRDTDNRVIILDEAKEFEQMTFRKNIDKFFADEELKDYNRFTLVRTKFDDFTPTAHVNRWLRMENDGGETCLGKNMKHAALSCPGPDFGADQEYSTEEQFQAELLRRNAADLKKVADLQAAYTSADSSIETPERNAELLKTVGFKNFALQLQTEVQDLFKEKQPEVKSKLVEESARLGKSVRTLQLSIQNEESLDSKRQAGARFAEVVAGVARLDEDGAERGPVYVVESRVEKGKDWQGDEVDIAVKHIVRTESLATDLDIFVKKITKDDIFVTKPDVADDLSAADHESALRLKEQERENAYQLLKMNLSDHLKALPQKKKADNKEGFPNSGSKFEALANDLTDYMHSAEANFNPLLAQESFNHGELESDPIKMRMTVVRDFMQADGKQMLLNHLTLVGRRVQDWMRELVKRTQTYMTKSLSIKTEQEKLRDVGSGWQRYQNTGIQEPAVYDEIYKQFELYSEILFSKFRKHYVVYLEALLHDPFSLLKTTRRTNSGKQPMFEPKNDEVQKRIEQLTLAQVPTSQDTPLAAPPADALKAQADAQQQAAQIMGNFGVQLPTAAAPVARADPPRPATEEEESDDDEEKRRETRALLESNRSRQIDEKIVSYFKMEEKFADPVVMGESVESLAKLLFRFARAKIADGLAAQIHRFFIENITGTGQIDPALMIPDIKEHMKKMNPKCFKPNQATIAGYKAEKKVAEKNLTIVNRLLQEERALPIV